MHHNSFYALGRYLKVGIVIGPSSWSDDTETLSKGASVYENTFQGDFFGYGIVVSSAEDFSVQGNKADPEARFRGVPGPRCPTAPPNGLPAPFLIHRGSAKGSFQDDFVNGEVQHSKSGSTIFLNIARVIDYCSFSYLHLAARFPRSAIPSMALQRRSKSTSSESSCRPKGSRDSCELFLIPSFHVSLCVAQRFR